MRKDHAGEVRMLDGVTVPEAVAGNSKMAGTELEGNPALTYALT